MSKALQREAELVAKARATREEIALYDVDNIPVNLGVIFSLAKYQYFMYQKYKGDNTGYWISKKAIASEKEKIRGYRSQITAGEHEGRAKEAAEEALELLTLVTRYRVRDNRKCRVY